MTSAAPAAARSERVYERRPGCPSRFHGVRRAYLDHGCGCADTMRVVHADRNREHRQRKLRTAGQHHAAPPALVPRIGTTRRLQALAADGYDATELSTALTRLGAQVDPSWLVVVRAGAKRDEKVRREFAAAVVHLFEVARPRPLAMHPPQLRDEVAANGWRRAVEWAGEDIDAPLVDPFEDARRCADCAHPMVSNHHPLPVPPGYRRHRGRELCRNCYGVHSRKGTLDQFRASRTDWNTDYLLDAWVVFREEGARIVDAATALDMPYDAFRCVLRDARKRGDTRGEVRTRSMIEVAA